MFPLSRKFTRVAITAVALGAIVCFFAPPALASKKSSTPKADTNHKPKLALNIQKLLPSFISRAAADNTDQTQQASSSPTNSETNSSQQLNNNQTLAILGQQNTNASNPSQTSTNSEQTVATSNSSDAAQSVSQSISMPADTASAQDPAAQITPPNSNPPAQTADSSVSANAGKSNTTTAKQTPSQAKQLAFNFTLPKITKSAANASLSMSQAGGLQSLPLLSAWEPLMTVSPYGFAPLSKQATAVFNTIALILLLLGAIFLTIKRKRLAPAQRTMHPVESAVMHFN